MNQEIKLALDVNAVDLMVVVEDGRRIPEQMGWVMTKGCEEDVVGGSVVISIDQR